MNGAEAVRQFAHLLLHEQEALLDSAIPVLIAADRGHFASLSPEELEGLRADCAAGLDRLLRVLGGEISDAAEVFELAELAGRRQVQQDLRLEGALRAYRIAGRAVWERMVEMARSENHPVDPAVLLDGATVLWQTVDDFCAHVSDAYRAEERTLRDRDARIHAAVFAALLDGRGADVGFARDAGHALAVPLDGPLLCVVALDGARGLLGPKEHLRREGVVSAWQDVGGQQVGIVALGRARADRVHAVLEVLAQGRSGISPTVQDASELPRAFRAAELAARTSVVSDRPLARLADDQLLAMVLDSALVAGEVFASTVGQLLAPGPVESDALLASLQAFLDCEGKVAPAAEKAFCHRNTMLYRLDKITKLTGVSTRTLRGQLVWSLGLAEHALRRAASEENASP